MIHEIALTGYKAVYTDGKCLHLGTKDSYGNEQLHLTLDESWSELAVTATFTNANEESITVSMESGNLVTVPPEAAAAPTSRYYPACIVFKGTRDGVQVITGDLPYIVEDHAPADGENSTEPTADQYAQFVAAVKADADRAEEAADRAEEASGDVDPDAVKDAVAEYLDANPVEATPIDATLTQSGQAADAKAVGDAIANIELTPGPQGEKGDPGADGYTPVRGTDYWTEEDIAEIQSYVDNAILNGAW